MSDELWMLVDIEDVILVAGLDPHVVQEAEELGAVIRAVVDHVEQHLPEDQDLVLPWRERLFDQHLLPQVCRMVTHVLLDGVPVGADALAAWKLGRIQRLGESEAAQRNGSTLVLVMNS